MTSQDSSWPYMNALWNIKKLTLGTAAMFNNRGSGALTVIPNLEEIALVGNVDGVKIVDGCLYSTDETSLYIIPNKASFTVPETVTYIRPNKYRDIEQLIIPSTYSNDLNFYGFRGRRVEIHSTQYTGSSERSALSSAFAGSDTLEEAVIDGGGYTYLHYTFDKCPNLRRLVIGEGVTTMSYALDNDYGLEYIDLPSTLTKLPDMWQCANLTTILIRVVTALNNSSSVFANYGSHWVGKDATGAKILYVPTNSTGYEYGIYGSLTRDYGFTLSKTL